MLDFIGTAGDWIGDQLGDTISSALSDILYATIYKLLYYIGWGLCKIVYYMDSAFEVFAGMKTITYNGKSNFLINVFFQNHAVSNVYWAMALLGIVFAFVFAIIAVIRRMFDLRDKDQRSMGQILGSLGKTLLLIVSMNVIIIVVLNATNILMQQIGFIFDNANVLDKDPYIDFTEEQYAAMGRCLNTIGNYSLNPSYNSRYNINACYNALRPDLDFLVQQGVFDFYYVTKESAKSDAATIETWQSVLQKIANARDSSQEIKMDVYDESLYNAVKDAMDELSKNNNLRPLAHYDRIYSKPTSEHVPIDRYLFLLGTFEAAKKEEYNKAPSFDDPVRSPYYIGTKSIYNLKQVSQDFDIGIHRFNYLILYLSGIALIWDFGVIIFSCVSRIFNMVLLYLISPLVFAAEPLDDGAKRKQWTTAFLVQTLGVFATVVAMRLSMLFVPVIASDQLVLFSDNSFMNMIGKVILVLGTFEVAKKANGLVTGILADSAGWQSIQAGDSTQRGDFAVAKAILPLTMAAGVGKWAITKAYDKVTGPSSGGGGSSSGGGGEGSLPDNQNK